jgi:hypothetical protein
MESKAAPPAGHRSSPVLAKLQQGGSEPSQGQTLQPTGSPTGKPQGSDQSEKEKQDNR